MDPKTRQSLVYDAHKKSLLISYLLWWFLGYLGVHRLYLGRLASALAMFLLFAVSTLLWITVVGIVVALPGYIVLGAWWLVDAFLMPGMVTRTNLRLIDRLV